MVQRDLDSYSGKLRNRARRQEALRNKLKKVMLTP
jgi:hypothetical protein